MRALLADDAADAGARRLGRGQLRRERILAAPVQAVAVQVLLAALRLRGGTPERDDVVHGLIARRTLDQRHRAFSPVAFWLHPHVRSPLVEDAVVLILLEAPFALHEAETLRTFVGICVD